MLKSLLVGDFDRLETSGSGIKSGSVKSSLLVGDFDRLETDRLANRVESYVNRPC